jgi:hypothetical protein
MTPLLNTRTSRALPYGARADVVVVVYKIQVSARGDEHGAVQILIGPGHGYLDKCAFRRELLDAKAVHHVHGAITRLHHLSGFTKLAITTAQTTPRSKKIAARGEVLDAVVACVSDVDSAICGDNDAFWPLELSSVTPNRPPLAEEFTR